MSITQIGFVLSFALVAFAQETPAPPKPRPARPPRPGIKLPGVQRRWRISSLWQSSR
jgi:hypothetical protein